MGILWIKITSLHRQLEKESEKHGMQLEKAKKDISYDTEKKIKAYEHEAKKMQEQVNYSLLLLTSC